MSTLDRLRARQHEINRLASRHGAYNIRLFGSVVRGEDQAKSDIDMLIDMDQNRSLLDLVGFQQELEALVKQPVDVLTENALHPYLRDRILAEAVLL